MTVRLYQQDVTLLDFSAKVVSCEEKNGQYLITLDQTAFFPEGGGQGADHGTLGGVHILYAHEVSGEVVHTADAPLTPGTTAEGHVDAVRRLSMMQQHSGEHIFSGLVHQTFGYDNVGFHIGTEAVTMDFNGPMTWEQAKEIEYRANEAVWKYLPVHAWIPSGEELASIEYRSKKEIDGDLRIVSIEGYDTCACCGTHVLHTGSIGQIKLLSLIKYKSGVRISILCGMRALEEENKVQEELNRIGLLLSGKPLEAASAVSRLLEERTKLQSEKEELGLRLFDAAAAAETGNVKVVLCDMLPVSSLRKAAAKAVGGARYILLLSPNGAGWNFLLHSPQEDIRPVTKELCSLFGGRGGGPKYMTQGMFASGTQQEIREKLESFL